MPRTAPSPRVPGSPEVTLVATAVPVIQVPPGLTNPAQYDSVPPPFGFLQAGASGPGSLTNPFNRNALQGVCASEGGGGGYGIETGLELSLAADLRLPISAGRANIRGRVAHAEALTIPVSGGVPRTYIWMSSTGVITPINDELVPPSGDQLFLGSCVVGATGIDSIDFSGVMYLHGGLLWRATADVGMPADTPPGDISFLNVTQGGLYLWSGARYWHLAAP